MSERQVPVRPVVTWEGAPPREKLKSNSNVIPFPTTVRETRETTAVEWVVGGTHQRPPVRLTGVTSGFGDVSKTSPRCLAA